MFKVIKMMPKQGRIRFFFRGGAKGYFLPAGAINVPKKHTSLGSGQWTGDKNFDIFFQNCIAKICTVCCVPDVLQNML